MTARAITGTPENDGIHNLTWTADGLVAAVRGDGDDLFGSGPAPATVYGGAGEDIFGWGPMGGLYHGGAGNDYFSVAGDVPLGSGSVTAYGDEGDDILYARGIDQPRARGEFYGGAGQDTLHNWETSGEEIFIRLDGGEGDDHFYDFRPLGEDVIDGGAGFDVVQHASNIGVTVSLETGLGSGDAQDNTYRNIECLFGSRGADHLIGDGLANILIGDDTLYFDGSSDHLEGGGGADLLVGGDLPLAAAQVWDGETGRGMLGNLLSADWRMEQSDGDIGGNILEGGAGRDVLMAGHAGDRLDGGRGRDTAVYLASGGSGVRVDLATGTAAGGDAAGGLLTRVENVVGTLRADRLSGDAGANLLHGMAGDDLLAGRGGNDKLMGRLGEDRLWGGRADDRLCGGRNADVLTGGDGADSFVFDSRPGVAQADRVTDFETGVDRVLLQDSVFTALPEGDLREESFAFDAATTAEHRVIYETATGDLFYDRDGVGAEHAAVLIAHLGHGPTGHGVRFWDVEVI